MASSLNPVVAALDDIFGPSDRRQSRRMGYEAPLVIEPCADGVCQAALTVLLQDYSTGGLGTLHLEPMAPGQQFIVSLRDRGQTLRVLCQVMHCRPQMGGRFFIGSQFCRLMGFMEETSELSLPWVGQRAFSQQAA